MRTYIRWQNRNAFLQRGELMISAHWRNLILDPADLDRWFARNYHKYAVVYNPHLSDGTFAPYLERVRTRFWDDVINRLDQEGS